MAYEQDKNQNNTNRKKRIQLDFKRAILIPFSGKDWPLKLIVVCLLVFSANINFYNKQIFIFMAFFMLICFGYLSQFSHNEINDIAPVLPSWKLDFIKYFKQGFFCLAGMFMYTLLICIIIVPIGVFADILKNKFLDNLYTILIPFMAIILTIIQSIYAEKFNFKDILILSKPIRIILDNKFEFLICVLFYFILLQLK